MKSKWLPVVLLQVFCLAGSTYCAEAAQAAVEKDLSLEIVPGTDPSRKPPALNVALRVTNLSKDQARQIVKAGDGSEAGWREPFVYFSAQRAKADGTWEDVPRRFMGRCGLYDSNWVKDAVNLKPGESVSLEWVSLATSNLDFSTPGKYRVVAHYVYCAGENDRSLAKPVALGALKDVPKFTLVSKPYEFTVEPPKANAEARQADKR